MAKALLGWVRVAVHARRVRPLRRLLEFAYFRVADNRRDISVALGLDASIDDPFKGFRVTQGGFARIGAAIAGAGLPTLFVQEGGYLSDSLGANLTRALSGFGEAA